MRLTATLVLLCFLTGCASVPNDSDTVRVNGNIDQSELIYEIIIQDAYALSEAETTKELENMESP